MKQPTQRQHGHRRQHPMLAVLWLALCMLLAPWSQLTHSVHHGWHGSATTAVQGDGIAMDDPWQHRPGSVECLAMDAGLHAAPVAALPHGVVGRATHQPVLLRAALPAQQRSTAAFEARGPPLA